MYATQSVPTPSAAPDPVEQLAKLREQLDDIEAQIGSAEMWIDHLDPSTLVITGSGSLTIKALLEKLRLDRVQCIKAIEGLTPRDDYFAEFVLRTRLADFDSIEIYGVRSAGWDEVSGKRMIAIDDDDPEFWSVYLHRVSGGHLCVADVSSESKARAYAKHLSRTYRLRFD